LRDVPHVMRGLTKYGIEPELPRVTAFSTLLKKVAFHLKLARCCTSANVFVTLHLCRFVGRDRFDVRGSGGELGGELFFISLLHRGSRACGGGRAIRGEGYSPGRFCKPLDLGGAGTRDYILNTRSGNLIVVCVHTHMCATTCLCEPRHFNPVPRYALEFGRQHIVQGSIARHGAQHHVPKAKHTAHTVALR
jgi:hypothetical protein